jgi:hypothetical protein
MLIKFESKEVLPMRILKKDFVDENTESYCSKGHRLSSGTAYYIQDENGDIHYGGTHCAKTLGVNDIKSVPDLTKSLVALGKNGQSGGSGGGSTGETNSSQIPAAIGYLLLREELLSYFRYNGRSLSYHVLNRFYQDYIRTGTISESDAAYIMNIEAKVFSPKLSFANLATCHAYAFILDRTFAHLEAQDKQGGMEFISSLKQYLSTHCTLQSAQVEGLKNWIQYLPEDLRKAKLKRFKA